MKRQVYMRYYEIYEGKIPLIPVLAHERDEYFSGKDLKQVNDEYNIAVRSKLQSFSQPERTLLLNIYTQLLSSGYDWQEFLKYADRLSSIVNDPDKRAVYAGFPGTSNLSMDFVNFAYKNPSTATRLHQEIFDYTMSKFFREGRTQNTPNDYILKKEVRTRSQLETMQMLSSMSGTEHSSLPMQPEQFIKIPMRSVIILWYIRSGQIWKLKYSVVHSPSFKIFSVKDGVSGQEYNYHNNSHKQRMTSIIDELNQVPGKHTVQVPEHVLNDTDQTYTGYDPLIQPKLPQVSTLLTQFSERLRPYYDSLTQSYNLLFEKFQEYEAAEWPPMQTVKISKSGKFQFGVPQKIYGTYAIYHKNSMNEMQLMYIGMGSVHYRLRDHLVVQKESAGRKIKEMDPDISNWYYTYKPAPIPIMRDIERILINRYRPAFNVNDVSQSINPVNKTNASATKLSLFDSESGMEQFVDQLFNSYNREYELFDKMIISKTISWSTPRNLAVNMGTKATSAYGFPQKRQSPVCGVYAFAHKEQIKYIGYTKNIAGRYNQQVTNIKNNNSKLSQFPLDELSFSFIQLPSARIAYAFESFLIEKLKPPFNSRTELQAWVPLE